MLNSWFGQGASQSATSATKLPPPPARSPHQHSLPAAAAEHAALHVVGGGIGYVVAGPPGAVVGSLVGGLLHTSPLEAPSPSDLRRSQPTHTAPPPSSSQPTKAPATVAAPKATPPANKTSSSTSSAPPAKVSK